ncbi:MAG: hypothetical protein RID81_06960 [Sandaracinaceae bacterium]
MREIITESMVVPVAVTGLEPAERVALDEIEVDVQAPRGGRAQIQARRGNAVIGFLSVAAETMEEAEAAGEQLRRICAVANPA